MDITIVLLVVLIALAVCILAAILTGRRQGGTKSGVELLDARLRDLRETLDTRLHQSAEATDRKMHDQFESSKKLIKDFTEEAAKMGATGREMISFTKQLQSLEQALKNPQRRGAVGEFLLERAISNALPPDSYATQHAFKSGARADAVIFLSDEKLLCIDAKFSLDNYTKLLSGEAENPAEIERALKEDIKMRIRETAKYILPNEGTLDYAFMFIPSESLYYDLLTQKIGSGDLAESLLEYGFKQHRVIIISPTTLLAYLQTVHLGLRSLNVEKHAHEIVKRVESLRKHLESYTTAFHGVRRALESAVNRYNDADRQYDLIDKDVLKITGTGGEYARDPLDRPRSSDRDD